MARIIKVRCDGCKSDLGHEKPWRYVRVSGLEDGEMEVCADCWRKMLAAIGRTAVPVGRSEDIDEHGDGAGGR